MIFVCLWSLRWSTEGVQLAELAAPLLEIAPRVVVDGRGVIWADARGLPAVRIARGLMERLCHPERSEGSREESAPNGMVMGKTGVHRPASSGIPSLRSGQALRCAQDDRGGIRAGIATIPVAAEVAARTGEGPVTVVDPGGERAFLAPHSLGFLIADPRLAGLLDGVGISRFGDLAALEREAVEVRFGAPVVELWRLSRGDDQRPLFRPIPPERPHASMLFVGYEVRQADRLLFTLHGLLGSVCETLERRGERAREMVLTFSLSRGGEVRESLRAARPTGDRTVWLRRMRETLERLKLPDAVVGLELEVGGTEPVSATQGDLFDRGFATAAPVEEAVIRLMDKHGSVFVEPDTSAHPLLERRTEWVVRPPEAAALEPVLAESSPALSLQLLRQPRPVTVRAEPRRDHTAPTSYFDGRRWHTLTASAGPDRVSGGQWEEKPFAREYYRCTTEEGVLVWLFHDRDSWFLHGWWD